MNPDNPEAFFLGVQEDLQTLFDVERVLFYAVDRDRRELCAKHQHGPQEIRLPINECSISGYCAKYGKLLNIANAQDDGELTAISPHLCFDRSWEEWGGLQPRQALAIPMLHNRKYLLGVLLLFNKADGSRFTVEDEQRGREIAETLGTTLLSSYQQTQPRPKTKFDHLLQNNLLTHEQLKSAMTEAQQKGQDVETVLLKTCRVPKDELGTSLSLFFDCPFMQFDDRIIIDPTLLKGINVDYLKANNWVPIRREHDTVDILIDNPRDLQKTEHIQFLMKGCRLRFFVGLRSDILLYIHSVHSTLDAPDSIHDILGELAGEEVIEQPTDTGAAVIDENNSAIVRLVNQIIFDAYKRGASDVHIEPNSARQDTLVRIRVDGECYEYQRIPPSYRRALVSRIKIMARLDIAERRKPQDGKIKFRLSANREIELRVATIPTANDNEDVVMRLLASNEPIPLDQLKMSERNLGAFQQMIRRPHGLILVVGPTGSGKTTTLHSALGAINTPRRKIWTAEDPVEITQAGLRQVQVNPHIGFTFAAAMRAFLRADPDVIMVGEMRDQETSHMGIEASLTGHLVFSTLHTNSAVETITRLLVMQLDAFNFADALLGVLAQRLVRTLCVACKVPYTPRPEELADLQEAYGRDAFARLGVQTSPDVTLCRAPGCPDCDGTGYKGRVALHELLINTDDIKKLIQNRAPVSAIRQVAQQDGMTTLLQDGVLKVLSGLTDLAQVKAVAYQ